MGHPVLLWTSLAMLFTHLAGIKYFKGPLIMQTIYILGPCASIWNHGSTGAKARWTDRLLMAGGFIIDILWLLDDNYSDSEKYLCGIHLLFAIACYVFAKSASGWQATQKLKKNGQVAALGWNDIHWGATLWHTMAHIYVTVAHCLMLKFSKSKHDLVADLFLLTTFLFVWGRTAAFIFTVLLWLFVIGVPSLLLFPVISCLFSKDAAQKFVWRCATAFFTAIVSATGAYVSCSGLENLDKRRSYIFASNHTSMMDIPLLFHALNSFWLISVSKQSVSKIPILGWLVRLGGSIFVTRSNPEASKRAMTEGAKHVLRTPKSILIFPEGRRSEHGGLQKLHKGVMYLSRASELPIVPVHITNAQDIIGRGFDRLLKPFVRVEVRFGKPLQNHDMDIMEALSKAMLELGNQDSCM